MLQKTSALKSEVACPVCHQMFWTLGMMRTWPRGDTAVCSECIVERNAEATAWVFGFDAALEWADGQAK